MKIEHIDDTVVFTVQLPEFPSWQEALDEGLISSDSYVIKIEATAISGHIRGYFGSTNVDKLRNRESYYELIAELTNHFIDIIKRSIPGGMPSED